MEFPGGGVLAQVRINYPVNFGECPEDVKDAIALFSRSVQDKDAECRDCAKDDCPNKKNPLTCDILGACHFSIMKRGEDSETYDPFASIIPDIGEAIRILPDRPELTLAYHRMITDSDTLNSIGCSGNPQAMLDYVHSHGTYFLMSLIHLQQVTPLTASYLDYMKRYFEFISDLRQTIGVMFMEMPYLNISTKNVYVHVGHRVYRECLQGPIGIPQIWRLKDVMRGSKTITYHFENLVEYNGENPLAPIRNVLDKEEMEKLISAHCVYMEM